MSGYEENKQKDPSSALVDVVGVFLPHSCKTLTAQPQRINGSKTPANTFLPLSQPKLGRNIDMVTYFIC